MLKNIAHKGIFLIAGTGSIGYLKLEGCPELRVYGDGRLLGSVGGSGFDIGQRAIRAALDIDRGVFFDEKTGREFSVEDQAAFRKAIEAAIPGTFSTMLETRNGVLKDLKEGDVTKVTGLAPRFFALAYEYNDSVAKYVLQETAQALGSTLKKLIANVSLPSDFPIYLCGGVFKSPYWEEYYHNIWSKDSTVWAERGLKPERFTVHNVASDNIAVRAMRALLEDHSEGSSIKSV